MSLRAFHIVLILATLGCFGFLAYWARLRGSASLMLGSGSCCVIAAVYLAWFLLKTRTPGT